MPTSPLLLICGPSGGGKSAFIRQLQQGRLPPDIRELLPESAAQWKLVEANDILKGDLDIQEVSQQLSRGEPLLVHYDIVFLHTRGLNRYEQDPAMALWPLAGPITVVFVRPDAATVQRQHLQRSARQQRKKSLGSRLWMNWIRKPLRRMRMALTGKHVVSSMTLYQHPHWLETCYEQWQDYLRSLLQRGDTSLLVVAPAPGSPSEEAFILLDRSLKPNHVSPVP